jgi:acyl carrier protein
MQRDQAIAIVQKAILEHEFVSSDKYSLSDTFMAIGVDSLDLVEISMLIEEEVHSDIDPSELNTIRVINDMVKLVERV